MTLIIGGKSAGKLDYVKSLGYAEEQISRDPGDDCPVLYGLQDKAAEDPEGAEALLPLLLKKEIVVCDEVGCGVIPLEKRDRQAREAIGRLCVLLAKNADGVVRVIAGIPTVIK